MGRALLPSRPPPGSSIPPQALFPPGAQPLVEEGLEAAAATPGLLLFLGLENKQPRETPSPMWEPVAAPGQAEELRPPPLMLRAVLGVAGKRASPAAFQGSAPSGPPEPWLSPRGLLQQAIVPQAELLPAARRPPPLGPPVQEGPLPPGRLCALGTVALGRGLPPPPPPQHWPGRLSCPLCGEVFLPPLCLCFFLPRCPPVLWRGELSHDASACCCQGGPAT